MSSPSSARVNASSSRIRGSRATINPGASRSRAFGASSVSNSSRQVAGTGGAAGGRSSARVYLDGVDVTPQSLLVSRIKPSSHDQRAGNKGKGKSGTRYSRPGASVVGASVLLTQDHLSTSSIDESDSDAPPPGPSTKTKSSNQQDTPAKPVAKAAAVVQPPVGTKTTPEEDDGGGGDKDADASGAALLGKTTAPKLLADIDSSPSVGAGFSSSTVLGSTVATSKPEKKERRPVTVFLSETPTEMLFQLRSVCVAQDASYHQAVAQRNRVYLEACAAKKGSDKFVEGRSQTLQLAQKIKEVMTAPPATRDSACMATDWDIFDCARIDDDNNNEQDDTATTDTAVGLASSSSSSIGVGSNNNGHVKARPPGDAGELSDAILKQQVVEIVDATTASPGCMLDVDGDIVEDLKARQHALRHTRKHRHGNSHSLNNSRKSRVFHASSGANNQSSQDFGRSAVNFSSSSMASPSQSSGNVSFGASQDVVSGGLGGGEDSSASNSVANSQIGLSGASRVFSNASDDGKASQNAYSRANANVDLGQTIVEQRTTKVLASASLLKTVSVVERAVQQNVYHPQHVLYRNFPSLAPSVASSAASSLGDSFRKDLHNHQHQDWRAGLGLNSSDSPPSSAGIVPPIGSFNAVSAGGSALASSRLNKKNTLEQLWAFTCCLTQGRTVTCLAWNSVNEDLLAVAYSRTEERPECPSPAAVGSPASPSHAAALAPPEATPITPTDDGLVLFWSLKNPEYPERIYNLDVGVTSIDFSRSHPYMLAVGFANGVVAIYDTRNDDLLQQPPGHSTNLHTGAGSRPGTASSDAPFANNNATPGALAPRRYVPVPVASSETSNGKHLDAVWQVKWISKGSDRGENVVSISSDGRVTEWSMKKGLSFSDLMTLKRVANPLLGSDARGDGGVISRQASGHCIDFATNDPSVYYVGTEDGIIHKCSVSYNEQYLQTYYGHTGPVYQILISPFSSDLFLSCSADWNVKVWHHGDQKELLNFRSVNLQHAVLGVSWCPSQSTMFGTVTEDGRIEIWDVQQSSLDPIITHYPKKFAPVAAAGGGEALKPSTAAIGGDTTAGTGFDSLDDLSGVPKDSSLAADAGLTAQAREIRVECTKIAFAPSAPVIVVGDSTGDVTVYCVPALTDDARGSEPLSHEEQVTRLHRAMNPNKQE